MNQSELIADARAIDQVYIDECINYGEDGILASLQTISMNGYADEESGDIEYLCGHFYRIDKWLVITDCAGNNEVVEFDYEFQAIKEFENLDKEYERELKDTDIMDHAEGEGRR